MKNKVLATILFSLLVVPLVQSADNSPRLVVGITVDQLRTDCNTFSGKRVLNG